MNVIAPRSIIVTVSGSNRSDRVATLVPILGHLRMPLVYVANHPRDDVTHTTSIRLYIGMTGRTYPLKLTPADDAATALIVNSTLTITLLGTHNFATRSFTLSRPNNTLNHGLLLHMGSVVRANSRVPRIGGATDLHSTLLRIAHGGLNVAIVYSSGVVVRNVFASNSLHHIFSVNISIHRLDVTSIVAPKKVHIHPNVLTIRTLGLVRSHRVASIVITSNSRLLNILRVRSLLHTNMIWEFGSGRR